jgi:hypothetical protein
MLTNQIWKPIEKLQRASGPFKASASDSSKHSWRAHLERFLRRTHIVVTDLESVTWIRV